MPQVGWYFPESKRRMLFEEALDEARDNGDLEGMPYEILAGIFHQQLSPRPEGLTVTTLLSNPRHVKLEKMNDYFDTPENNYATFRGSIVHSIMESYAADTSIVEERQYKTFQGVEISGQPDTLQIRESNGRTLLRDWKTTKELPRYDNPYSNHMAQVNLYRWLLNLDPDNTDLEVVYISMEGVKTIPLKHGGRSSRGRAITQQHWSDEKVEELIAYRLELHMREPILRYEDIPEEDQWQCRYSPVENLCRRLAAREAHEAWGQGRDVRMVPERIVARSDRAFV